MGELIRREAASAPLDFSGERLTAAITGQVEIEHYHRYLLAREYCRGLDVLDVAAGEGYGSALLSQVARSVVGVEIDPAVVEAAQKEFGRTNLRYVQGDARAIPLADASVDVAVSFETLEHLAEQEQFLSELKRVLKPGGLLIISTPDRDIYSPIGSPPNLYHVLELTRAEFETLVLRHFKQAAFAAQRPMIGSAIFGDGRDPASRSYERRGEHAIEASNHLARAPYIIAFASDREPPPVPDSVYVHRDDLDTESMAKRDLEAQFAAAMARADEGIAREAHGAKVIAALEAEAAGFRAHIATLQGEIDASSRREAITRRDAEAAKTEAGRHYAQAEALKAAQQALGQEIAALQQQATANEARLSDHVHHLIHRLQAIETSTIWRATKPLRAAGARAPGPLRLARRAARLGWWTLTFQLPRRYRVWKDFKAAQAGLPSPSALEAAPAAALLAKPLLTASDIVLRTSDHPVVSVIISTYGQLALTLGCLKSIADHPPRHPIEVLLVDDAYPGAEDMSSLKDVAGVRFIVNPTNLGFLLSCNAAARQARGRHIYMLNNDTELKPGAIDSLVDLLDSRPNIGLAGSKLIYPDGRLQEAGGILWSDGSGWNYGKGDDPARPEYNYVREADYISGASIMVPRALWEELGGFDESYAPAYCEDSDLAFRIRARGLKVVYEPRSVVVHYEGMSHGTDLAKGIKAHQVINQARLVERWKDAFKADQFEGGQHVVRARDRSKHGKLILVIDHYVPEPDRDAGSKTMRDMISCLSEAGWTVKFWPMNRVYSPVYTAELEGWGVEVIDQRWPGGLGDWLVQNGADLDHVLVSRPQIADEVLPILLRGTDAVLSYYGHDLHFERMRRQGRLMGDAAMLADAETMEQMERRVWRSFDIVLYPSDDEASTVRRLSPRTAVAAVTPYRFDPSPARTTPPSEPSLLFVAGFAHPPNIDAAQFLARDVLPLVEAEIGPVRLVLAGSNPTQAVKDLAGPRVEVTGYISNEALQALYTTTRVSVVPLRYGAGVKCKVAEAMSRGLPLVTTPTGVEGLAGAETVAPVSDQAPALAKALARLLTDDAAWLAQSAAQMEFARTYFSPPVMRASWLAALEAAERGSAAAAPLPAGGIEIDLPFESLEQWLAWVDEHPGRLEPANAAPIGERIQAAGFVEPLSGRRIAPLDIRAGAGNWREELVAYGINSRVRAVLRQIDRVVGDRTRSEVRIFATEAVTGLAMLLRGLFPRFVGSEYGSDAPARDALFPIPHQDLTALALPSDSFDIVTTNEVLEHVPDLDAALREIARVLKPGGWHIGTHPFLFMAATGDLRAKLVDGELVHLKPPEYHENPVDCSGGSLVFETPGWDIVERAKAAGFSDVRMRFMASERFGYLTENTGVFVLCAQK